MFEIGPKISAKMKKPTEGIFLRCDKTVPFGAFATLMDALRQSGISNISIVTEPLPEKGKG
jgi:biopolymer transport protein ExbD/biopolymer transport protein TolR